MNAEPARSSRRLNIGCGRRFHPDWVNVDVQPTDPSVLAHDVRRGIPFPDESFDLVYHSHLLEHLPQQEGRQLLRECCRVLARGGIIRVAVPDLEQIARLYLEALEQARQGDREWESNYDWMMIELYDQTVRERSGGDHGTYLNRDVIPNVEFVLMRQGKEVEESISGQRLLRAAGLKTPSDTTPGLYRRVRRWLSSFDPSSRRERRLKRLLGHEYELLVLGRFRRSGEIHQWMYDSFSLSRALVEAGFVSPRRMCAGESHVSRWADFCLDTEPDGRVYKPDSLYVEAVKGDQPCGS